MLKKIIVFISIQSLLLVSFAQTYSSGQCQPVPNSKTCIDATPCKTMSTGENVCLSNATKPSGALTLPQNCWQYSHQYACTNSASKINTCTPFSTNSACTIKKTECTSIVSETGECNQWQSTYACQTQAAKTKKETVCSMGALSGGPNIPSKPKTNDNFSQAMLTLEIARQASVYNQNGANFFAGVPESCTTGYFGIKNCCKSTPGAKSNAAAMSLAFNGALSVAKYAGGKSIDTVSPYVFDTMYNSGLYTNGMLNSLATSSVVVTSEFGDIAATNFAGNGLTLSAYGFTYGAGLGPAAGSGFLNSTSTIWQSGDSFITFNPYVFAGTVAVQLIMSLASCSQEEQLLALHRGANLSTEINKYCSQRVPIVGTCVEWTTEFCSFTSVMFRLINIQGKAQLGKPLAGCAGLAIEDLNRIDFTKIDFSEMTQPMIDSATANTPTNIKDSYQTTYDGKLTQGSRQGGSAAIPTYKK